jgi:hypothetical protein
MPGDSDTEVEALPAYEPEGTQFHEHGFVRMPTKTASSGASLSGPVKRYGKVSDRAGMGGSDTRAKQKERKPRQYTPEELNQMADHMAAAMAAQHRAQLSMGPAVAPLEYGQTPSLQDAHAAQAAQTTNQFQTGPQQGGPPPWLQGYMAQQPQGGNPYAKIPPPNQMSPEQRQAYGAERPAWLTGK